MLGDVRRLERVHEAGERRQRAAHQQLEHRQLIGIDDNRAAGGRGERTCPVRRDEKVHAVCAPSVPRGPVGNRVTEAACQR